ncbi:putative MATE family efflux protein [Haloferula luteola]|uniref:Putative MATE family efflux protein n=1 Tax=Haloferula luteola TaxID=595692 RepID=A0A840VBG9_9BACT|nr:MATE family efflux transporter [Haloferula luteola]MBB5352894.1 putative MATE family efflux protein [Haloferula luteola]
MSRALSLTTDPIDRLTWRIAWPMSIGMFFNTMYNVVDTWCAGWLGTEALAALSLSFPVFMVVMVTGSGLSQGTTALMAQAWGGGRPEEAKHVFAQSLLLALAAGLVMSVVGNLAAGPIFRLLGAEGSYLTKAQDYMRPVLYGSIFILMPMALNAALMALGETRHFRNFLIGGFVANCALNPVLMWGWGPFPEMGVSGLAVATVLIQAGGVGFLGRQAWRSEVGHGLAASHFKPDAAVLRQIAGQGVPAALNMLTVALGVFVITWFVQRFGKEAVAAIGIATRVEQIVLLPAMGLNTAVLSIVGQNHGAGLPERVREAWVTAIKAGAGLMILGGFFVGFLRGPAMRLFTPDETVISHGSDYLLTSAITLAAYPILFITVFAMQGIKRPAYGLWMGISRQLVAPFLVYQTLAFGLGWGLWGIWWGITCVTWSAALFSLYWGYRRFCRPSLSTIKAVSQD